MDTTLIMMNLTRTFLVSNRKMNILRSRFTTASRTNTQTRLITMLNLSLMRNSKGILMEKMRILSRGNRRLLINKDRRMVNLITVLRARSIVTMLLPTVNNLMKFTQRRDQRIRFLNTSAISLLTSSNLSLIRRIRTRQRPNPSAKYNLTGVTNTLRRLNQVSVNVDKILTRNTRRRN